MQSFPITIDICNKVSYILDFWLVWIWPKNHIVAAHNEKKAWEIEIKTCLTCLTEHEFTGEICPIIFKFLSHKKAFQSTANRPLSDSPSFLVNKFECVRREGGTGPGLWLSTEDGPCTGGWGWGPAEGLPHGQTEWQTDMTANVTFAPPWVDRKNNQRRVSTCVI